jgi:hypothetical protein
MFKSKTKPKGKSQQKSVAKSKIKQHPKVIKHQMIDGKKSKLYLMETNTHLQTFVEYRQAGIPPVGAMLLNTGTAENPQYRVRFMLKCDGLHHIQDEIQAESAIAGITALIREVPEGESLRIYRDCFPDTIDRELELTQTFHRIYENADLVAEGTCAKMVVEEIKILREGHRLGRRKPQQIHLAVTFSAKTEEMEKDPIEHVVDFFAEMPSKLLGKVSGSTKLLAQESLDRFLLKAYESGYQFWTALIRERVQMPFEPLDAENVWQFIRLDVNRFHDRDLRTNAIINNQPYQQPSISHLITYDLTNHQISELSESRLHPTTLIYEELSSIPATGRDYVYADGKYIGCLYLKSQPKVYESNPKETLSQVQLLHLWKILSKRFCYDMRVVLEMTTVNQVAIALNNADLIKQAEAQQKDAQRKGRTDYRASMRLEEVIEVERILHNGDPSLDYSLVVYFHRDTLSDLRSVMNQFRQCFVSPSKMLIDADTADSIWLQGLPYYGKSILVDNRDRRDRTQASALASYMPLLMPQSPHQKGMEFISIQGDAPIWFDPFDPKNQGHMALWGQTRSGKSLLAAWFILRALIDGVKTTIIDQPPSGEASTFKDFVAKLGGGYIDVLNNSLNPFELPNLPAAASEAHRNDLRQESQGYLLRVLSSMVLGHQPDSSPHTKRVEGFLPVILQSFLDNDQIKLRYIRARQGGINSSAWKNHPILEDYVTFCEVSHIGLSDATPEDLSTMSFIRNQLRKWTSGQHATVLNSPSTVEIDSPQLLAIAMRGVSGGDESAVFGSLIYLVAMRRAIAASATPKGSFLFVDEAASTLKIRPICDSVTTMMVNGLKSRMRVCLASQEPGSVATSANGDQIMDALKYQLIGRIGSDNLAAYHKYLNLPYELAILNAADNFAPDPITGSSQWLFKFTHRFTPVRAYLPQSLIKLTGSNIEERLERRAEAAAELAANQLATTN